MGNKRRVRPLGDVTTDLEPLLFELVDIHKLQAHEVLGIIYAWISLHYPGAIEEFEDGTNPSFIYR